MRFEDFVLQFDTTSRGGFRARVLRSPFGEGNVGFSIPSIGEAGLGPLGPSRNLLPPSASPSLDARPPLEVGAELYHAVFQGQVRSLLDKSRGQLEKSTDLGLRLKIKIDPGDRETGALADLPWELLNDETEDFFALSRQTSLVRYLDVPRSSQPIPFTPPLRILAVGASPRELTPLDLDEEMRGLDELNRSSAGIEVQFLSHVSAGALRELLSADTFNVLHFMGHGTFDATTGEGMLAFEAPDGSLDLVSGRAFATKLKDLRSLGVVVLNACDTARARGQGGDNPFRGVATALVLGGVPAVVAMQRPISDRSAIGFSAAFYRHLARGDSIDEALTEGRQAIHSATPETFEWATPVLFLRIPEGNVFVAKPAVRPEPVVEVAAPAPVVTAPPPAPLPPGPTSSRRGWVLKASGAAGAVLMASVLYTKVLAPHPSSPTVDVPSGTEQDLSSQGKTEPKPLVGGGSGKKPSTVKTNQTNPAQPKAPDPKPEDSTAVHGTVPPPPPVKPPVHETETPAPVADLSRLSAQMLSIARRDEGGLRVTVSFKNTGEQPLSAVLDAESSVLTDTQGQRYLILDSDLPAAGSNPRLDLAAGASGSHTFDFPMPKLGSKQFYLALATPEGHRIRVSGSPVTLTGSP